MIKNTMKKTLLACTLLSSSLMADYSDYTYNGYSLVGVELGYSSMSAEMTDKSGALPYRDLDGDLYNAGLKIGAQTGNYRVFLNANIHQDTDGDFDYITTYGVEGQYLFDTFEWGNFFIGAGAGLANMKFKVDGENFSRTINDPYFMGTLGFNFHATDGIDIEVGGRYMELDAVNTIDNVEYRFNDIMSVYTSIIFKYQMD